MKVTVCFGNVRVVVPCGGGDILVKDLIREATLRYKKATGKGTDSWVSVHNLQSQGGGILDPDDRLSDVVDDREQILASFEDGDGTHHHGGGDGASGSSVGTGSPDIFHDGEHKYGPSYPRTDIEVTGEQIASGGIPGALLQVRRGSEPALNQLLLPVGGPPTPSEHTKRWSAAPLIVEQPSLLSSPPLPTLSSITTATITTTAAAMNGIGGGGYVNGTEWAMDDSREDDDDDDVHGGGVGGNGGGGFRRIARDGSSRLSMQFLGDGGGIGGGYRWAEAAERAAATKSHTSTSLPRESKRKEPLGQANNSTSPLPMFSDNNNTTAELIIIRNEPGPLGIHVVPDYDRLGKDRGLLVQGIEPAGRIDRDGRLAIYDRIIEINGQNLLNMPFQRVQEMFKLSLTSPELRLKVIKNNGLDSLRKPPPPIYPRFPEDKENMSMVECEQKQSTNTKVATVSPTKKVPAISKNLKSLLSANTRKIGRKIEIELIKGPHGLGFSITTRDNPAGGNCPIYIKNIIPKGAAVEDGRLKIGDRLLEVNGIEMTGKSQAEAVAVLRNAPSGGKVRIVVSRQEDVVDVGGGALPRIIDTDYSNEKDVLEQPPQMTTLVNSSDHDVPPNIPPLPQSHLQALQNRGTIDNKNSSVAKIISQFQEAAATIPATTTTTTIAAANNNLNNNCEKSSDDTNVIFPWKHREILTFNIPVHDSEKAGLGISVKGKTSGLQDLGIFIKSVINGGAASRDKRLRTNDQLLNVNGISLLQQSNSDAMETLRKAMLHTEGPVPGNITLTIARRASSPSSSGTNRSFIHNNSTTTTNSGSSDSINNNKVGSDSNLLFNGCGSNDLLYYQSHHQLSNNNDTDPSRSSNSGTSSSSTNTVIFNPHGGQQINNNGCLDNSINNQSLSPMHTWNPVLDRLTGNNNKQLRNESYYKAAHDTWLSGNNSYGNLTTTTLNLTSAEPILIEDEYGSRILNHHHNSRINVHMTNKMNLSSSATTNGINNNNNTGIIIPSENRKDHEPDGKATNSNNMTSTGDSNNKTTSNSSAVIQQGATDATYASQLSLENPMPGFSRDAFGRQSMSEKRHATLDAKSTDTYQRTKKLREERSKSKEDADKLGQLGPSLGMKKSSSLESLQTMVQEIQMQEECDPAYSYRGPSGALKVIRGRGCEESFRAAAVVDKHNIIVDPNHKSEISAKKHWLLDPPMENEREIDGFNNVRGAPRQSSLNAALDSKHKGSKKKPSILKGIGSMFRFGKNRKMEFPTVIDSSSQHYHHTNSEFVDLNVSSPDSENQLNLTENPQAAATTERLQEHQNQKQQQQLQQQHHQQQREQQILREPIYQRHGAGFMHRHAEQVQVIPENAVAPPPPPVKYRNPSDPSHRRGGGSNSERKLQEQRLRHTYYQQCGDDRDQLYDQRQPQQLKQQQQQQRMDQNNVYGEYGRPGSRSGITESVPFTHYVNYNELQNHLNRKQHQYHSQRQARTDNQLRPVSNFYEYESVQSVLNSRMQAQHNNNNNSQKQQQTSDLNANSVPRQSQLPSTTAVQGRHHNTRMIYQQPPPPPTTTSSHRGPFVTHVTIGEQQQQQHQKNGTKV